MVLLELSTVRAVFLKSKSESKEAAGLNDSHGTVLLTSCFYFEKLRLNVTINEAEANVSLNANHNKKRF